MEQELLKNTFERHDLKRVSLIQRRLRRLSERSDFREKSCDMEVTAQEMGLYEALSEKNEVIWHWKKAGREMSGSEKCRGVHNQR